MQSWLFPFREALHNYGKALYYSHPYHNTCATDVAMYNVVVC
jgi:hypothetical protein